MRINEQTIRLFIEKKLSPEDSQALEAELRKSPALFNLYLEIKESLKYQKIGFRPSEALKMRILDRIREQHFPRFSFNLCTVGPNLVIVPEAENEFLTVSEVSSSLDQNSPAEKLTFSFAKTIQNTKLCFSFSQQDDGKLALSIGLNEKRVFKLSAMFSDGTTEESKCILSEYQFEKSIAPSEDLEIAFLKNDKLAFKVHFKFE